jgi:hypothetical protein
MGLLKTLLCRTRDQREVLQYDTETASLTLV